MDLNKRPFNALGAIFAALLAIAMTSNLYAPAEETAVASAPLAHALPATRNDAVRPPPGGSATTPAPEANGRSAGLVRLLTTLLLISGATLTGACWSARRLAAEVERLARGEPAAGPPAFRPHAFRRIANVTQVLVAERDEARAAQRTLAGRLSRVQEDERRALARELHDEMGQTLTALSATAAHLERCTGSADAAEIAACAGELRRDVRACGRQLRGVLQSLRPRGPGADGLAGALRELVDGWRTRATDINFRLDLTAPLPPLADETAQTLYRVVQEALTNVVRHSGARRCAVRLAAAGGDIRIEIEDDGCGMPAHAIGSGFGLPGMAERLDMIGGYLELAPGTAGGLCLTAALPAHNGEEHER